MGKGGLRGEKKCEKAKGSVESGLEAPLRGTDRG